MTLVKDKNNNIISSNHKDILRHYLQPDYIDKYDKTYSSNSCPLSMLAETCNNIGKTIVENPPSQSQESTLPISPSCSSSCSAPKFSPNSFEFSPADVSKFTDEHSKEKNIKEKSKKRKAVKRDNQDFMEKRIPPESNGMLNSPYSIAEFLKLNNFPPNILGKQEASNQMIHPFYNHLLNHNMNSQFQASSVWKSKPAFHPRMPFPVGYPGSGYQLNSSAPPQMFRPPQPNLIHELNHLYNNCQLEKQSCDCVVCCHKRNIEKNLIKVDPSLYNSLNCLRLHRPMNNPGNHIGPQMLPNMPSMGNGSSIKYCMYCGNYIPQIQNLLNHIHSEHVDQISSNFPTKGGDSSGNFHFQMESAQSKELKSREILKQLHLLYNSDNGDDHCVDNKPLLMR